MNLLNNKMIREHKNKGLNTQRKHIGIMEMMMMELLLSR
jgi:hypothetical protein